jgi:hypothetical protein
MPTLTWCVFGNTYEYPSRPSYAYATQSTSGRSARSVAFGVSSIMSMAMLERGQRAFTPRRLAMTLCTPSAATTADADNRRPSRACSTTSSSDTSTCAMSKPDSSCAPRRLRRAHERVIELDAADEQHRRIIGLEIGSGASRPLQVQAGDAMDVHAGQRGVEPRKTPQRADADAAATGLVARKCGAIDEQRAHACGGQRPRRDSTGRTGAGDDYLRIHRINSGRFGGLPCISRPTRKMRPAAQTTTIVTPIRSTTERSTCHSGGPGASPGAASSRTV